MTTSICFDTEKKVRLNKLARLFIRSKCLRQKNLSRLLKVPEPTLVRMLDGHALVTKETVEALAQELLVNPAVLVSCPITCQSEICILKQLVEPEN